MKFTLESRNFFEMCRKWQDFLTSLSFKAVNEYKTSSVFVSLIRKYHALELMIKEVCE